MNQNQIILKVYFYEHYYRTKIRKKRLLKYFDFDSSMYIIPATRPKTKRKLSIVAGNTYGGFRYIKLIANNL